jgi:[acyl-carrier-protein] S-malonyltransferase
VRSPTARAPESGHSRQVLVIAAPGQGAQRPGFLISWLEDPTFADRLHWLSAVAGIDLAHYGTQADAEAIRDTAIAQPLIVGSGLVAALALFPQPSDAFDKVGAAAGHSVGEITAATGVGILSAEQAMVLVRERGKAMAEASGRTPTGMTAVLGGDRQEVLDKLHEHGLVAANDNGPGQVVAAGTLEQLAALDADPPPKARLTPLSVAGAFHTHHMAPAVDALARYARAISTHDPRTRLLSNLDGQVVADPRRVLARIVKQVSEPVRWDLCMNTMADMGVTGVLEMPPAGTLTGILRRALPDVATFALKTPDQLDDARAFVDKHGTASPMDSSPSWRLLVAPMKGTFNRAPDLAADSEILSSGAVIGAVRNLRDELDVRAPHGGTIVEWLVEDGDLVSPGQPLIRLHPEAVFT